MSGHICYVLFDERGEPFYIGIGSKSSRPTDHVRYAKRGRRGRRYSKIRRMLRTGFDMPIVVLRDGMTLAEAKEMEIAIIAILGRHPNGPLTNISPGGNAPHENNPLKGRIVPLDVRTKISAKLTGRKLGPYSAERIEKTRKSLIGRKCGPHSASHKAILAETTRISWLDPAIRASRTGMAGKKHKSETIEKMRASADARIDDSLRARMALCGQSNAGKVWINNGLRESKTSQIEAIPGGWLRGRLSSRR